MGDMAEDFRLMKERDRERRERNLKAADPTGWTKRTEYHWQRTVCGHVMDYWPTRNKFRWKGKTHHGGVGAFITKQEKKHNPAE